MSATTLLLGLRFRIQPGHGCLSVESVVSCQVEVSTTDRSLVRRSATECGVSVCDLETSAMKRPWRDRAVAPKEKKYIYWLISSVLFNRFDSLEDLTQIGYWP